MEQPGAGGASEPDLAAARDETEHGAKRGRLADAVAAQQRGDAALGDVERDALQAIFDFSSAIRDSTSCLYNALLPARRCGPVEPGSIPKAA